MRQAAVYVLGMGANLSRATQRACEGGFFCCSQKPDYSSSLVAVKREQVAVMKRIIYAIQYLLAVCFP